MSYDLALSLSLCLSLSVSLCLCLSVSVSLSVSQSLSLCLSLSLSVCLSLSLSISLSLSLYVSFLLFLSLRLALSRERDYSYLLHILFFSLSRFIAASELLPYICAVCRDTPFPRRFQLPLRGPLLLCSFSFPPKSACHFSGALPGAPSQPSSLRQIPRRPS